MIIFLFDNKYYESSTGVLWIEKFKTGLNDPKDKMFLNIFTLKLKKKILPVKRRGVPNNRKRVRDTLSICLKWQ